MPPERGNESSNFTFDRTAGSHSLAAAGQRDRSPHGEGAGTLPGFAVGIVN